ncbi:MlaA family lipoprotein [Azospirillum halopraeferens]|uniref:MlaA family lipoprotein n=1 Tax=Azospirillum halopraeferens TaxID=34010 RepID=UPI0004911370|nr:MlaA family lipoprotein [Azospirillum halopraeferens]
MPGIRAIVAAAIMTVAMVAPLPIHAEESWLDRFNGAMFSFNAGVAGALEGAAAVLPPVPPEVGEGARNVALTWIGEPLNAGAFLVAGRTDLAGTALNRMYVNITRGWLGVVDRAAGEGMPTRSVDYGLALCTRGVPAGPFIVVPFTGVRTVRDFTADWVAAHVVLYAAVFGVAGLPVSLETLAAVEVVEEVITLSLAGHLGDVPPDARVDQLSVAQERYLAGRERLCSELAGTAGDQSAAGSLTVAFSPPSAESSSASVPP